MGTMALEELMQYVGLLVVFIIIFTALSSFFLINSSKSQKALEAALIGNFISNSAASLAGVDRGEIKRDLQNEYLVSVKENVLEVSRKGVETLETVRGWFISSNIPGSLPLYVHAEPLAEKGMGEVCISKSSGGKVKVDSTC